MEERRKGYILLQDHEGCVKVDRTALGLPPKSTPAPVLKGELLQAIPQPKPPKHPTRLTLSGIERKELYLECEKKDVIEVDTLLALYPSAVRYKKKFFHLEDDKRQALQSKSSPQKTLEEARKQIAQEIAIGQRVVTIIKDVRTRGTVRYIGEEKDARGDTRKIVGLELDEKRGHGDGKKQLFTCKKDHAVFVDKENIIPETEISHGIPGSEVTKTTTDEHVTLPTDDDLKGLQEELSQKGSSEARLLEQIQDLKKLLTEKDQQLKDNRGQLEIIRFSQERRLKEQIREYNSRLFEKDTQLRQQQEQLIPLKEHKERETCDLQNELQVKRKKLSDLERELRDREQDIVKLQRDLSKGKETLSKYESQLKTRDWILSRDEVELTGKRLGEGSFGIVLEGRYCDCPVAVKKLKESIFTPQALNLFEREMDIASRIRHPCLLLFIGASEDENSRPLFIVTELMDISLRALLGKRQLSETEVSVISLDVARALEYLHQRKPTPIIHRDVSSANVLLRKQNDQWRGKLSDYGTARFVAQIMTKRPGAPIYAAPEAYSTDYQTEIDVYSFGALLTEMCLKNELPDPDRREEQVRCVKYKGFGIIILWCIEDDPEDRPTMTEVIKELKLLYCM